MKVERPIGGAVAAAVVIALAASAAPAAPVASEDWSYGDGPIDGAGQNGGAGWEAGTAWTAMTQMQVESGRLRFDPDGWHPGETDRPLDAAQAGPLFFSYTLNATFDYRASIQVFLGHSTQGIEKFLFKLGHWNGSPFWDYNTQGDEAGDTPKIDFGGQPKPAFDGTRTFLIVGKIEFDVNPAGEERLSFWLDPTGPGPPLDALEKDSGITAIDLVRINGWENASSGDVAYLDDLRLGTAWEDVAPVPEPATAALLALGAGAALLGRRRRRGC